MNCGSWWVRSTSAWLWMHKWNWASSIEFYPLSFSIFQITRFSHVTCFVNVIIRFSDWAINFTSIETIFFSHPNNNNNINEKARSNRLLIFKLKWKHKQQIDMENKLNKSLWEIVSHQFMLCMSNRLRRTPDHRILFSFSPFLSTTIFFLSSLLICVGAFILYSILLWGQNNIICMETHIQPYLCANLQAFCHRCPNTHTHKTIFQTNHFTLLWAIF